jgi:hypothetical protein
MIISIDIDERRMLPRGIVQNRHLRTEFGLSYLLAARGPMDRPLCPWTRASHPEAKRMLLIAPRRGPKRCALKDSRRSHVRACGAGAMLGPHPPVEEDPPQTMLPLESYSTPACL